MWLSYIVYVWCISFSNHFPFLLAGKHSFILKSSIFSCHFFAFFSARVCFCEIKSFSLHFYYGFDDMRDDFTTDEHYMVNIITYNIVCKCMFLDWNGLKRFSFWVLSRSLWRKRLAYIPKIYDGPAKCNIFVRIFTKYDLRYHYKESSEE